MSKGSISKKNPTAEKGIRNNEKEDFKNIIVIINVLLMELPYTVFQRNV
jgi:hypothetical protein